MCQKIKQKVQSLEVFNDSKWGGDEKLKIEIASVAFGF